ncbi:acylphosphatase [Atribacter laminatus]|uniref:acylphosphatase n=1 Tax=Atribacter laminatus TaxID=2847778 RepID=A0A7T1ANZ5_ATRLM|nr:acylphosphatase [Atribacter laminatus]QPM69408.1 Acylphosphatase [Atribacter laminatus]
MKYIQGRLVFRGRVQGVGFRYFVLKRASGFEVTGFVKNLYHGEVEVVAEGEKSEVESFFREIREGPVSASIRDIFEEWLPYSGNYETFQVEY